MRLQDPKVAEALNAGLGLASEAGEVAEIIKKWVFHLHPMTVEDRNHLKKELGDMQWYFGQCCDAFGFDPAEILWMNIEKLRARYPQGFDAEKSINRAPGDV